MESEVLAAIGELSAGWVDLETEGADFSDKRLDARYSKVLGQMSRMPQAPINQSAECLSEMLAAYRFIDNSKVTVEKLLEPHREQIARRAEQEQIVLLVQDTTYLDYDDHLKCTDLKPFKPKKLNKALWLHSTLCVLPNGLPLGIADTQYLTGNGAGKNGDTTRPIETKMSYRWLKAVDNCGSISPANVRKIWVCDREADIYELFAHIDSKGEDFVIRSKSVRAVEEEDLDPASYETVLESAPVEGNFELHLRDSRTRETRTAKISVKYLSATTLCPKYLRNQTVAKTLPTYLVDACEENPPPGCLPVRWRLLTSLKVDSLEDALRIIGYYRTRWSTEDLFKILKSGCRVEKAQFQTVARLTKYITLSIIVAWRIYFLVHVCRTDPDAPVEAVLTKSEHETLQILLDDKRSRKKKRRVIIRTAGQAINQIARMGGYLDRRSDPHPGIVVIWRGTMALAFSTMTYLAQQRTANR